MLVPALLGSIRRSCTCAQGAIVKMGTELRGPRNCHHYGHLAPGLSVPNDSTTSV
jgi:hypothetical protein